MMNLLQPVSTIMSSNLLTINPKDKLLKAKAIFDANNIHHLPVVEGKKLVGIVSKTDLLYFLRGLVDNKFQKIVDESRLNHYCSEDIMTKGLAKLNPEDRINVAIEVFKVNLFHAIPVVNDADELVGIVTTYDIILALSKEEVG